MLKRSLPLLLAVGVLACLALPGLRLLWPRPGVTPDNFKRLRQGMTREHVEAILGRPGREEGPDTVWEGDRCRVSVQFVDINYAWAGQLETDDGQVLSLPPEPAPFQGPFGWLFLSGPPSHSLVACLNDGYDEGTPLREWAGSAFGLLLCLGLAAVVVCRFLPPDPVSAAAACSGSGHRPGAAGYARG
jgi:hypothetical protein